MKKRNPGNKVSNIPQMQTSIINVTDHATWILKETEQLSCKRCDNAGIFFVMCDPRKVWHTVVSKAKDNHVLKGVLHLSYFKSNIWSICL